MIEVANVLSAPLKRSIENLLRLAGTAVGSDEASVLVVDDKSNKNLRFLIAIGEVADKLQNARIPSGKGIAGFVFSSGQPLAIADVGSDENFYGEIDRQTGYSTQIILATPLRFEGEIIGVLEFVNRQGEPPYAPFTPEEMDRAALYAETIATLVDAYESASLLEKLSARILSNHEKTDFREWLENLQSSEAHRQMLETAVLVRRITDIGDAERKLCREILESFLRYTNDYEAHTNFLNF